MHVKLYIAILLILCPTCLFSQRDNKPVVDIFGLFTEQNAFGQVSIEQPGDIKMLFNNYVDFRKKEVKIPGYRIRIFSNSGQTARASANEDRVRFLKAFPDEPTYLEYEAPNFKVYVGDYRSRIEAFVAYKLMSKEFKHAFLVPSKINLPKL